MPDLARHLELQRLLEELRALEDQLLENERSLLHELERKYAEPSDGDFDDLTCLQVMLRNVEIRRGYATDAEAGPHQRKIAPKRRGGG